jgi:hypothetical protein
MNRKLLVILSITLLLGLFMNTSVVSAQEPPHPPQPGHGTLGNQSPGGTARIGDGAAILIAFALAYGYRKIKQKKKPVQFAEDQEDNDLKFFPEK